MIMASNVSKCISRIKDSIIDRCLGEKVNLKHVSESPTLEKSLDLLREDRSSVHKSIPFLFYTLTQDPISQQVAQGILRGKLTQK